MAAMVDGSGPVRPNGRRPKYRTSCDNCQTAKIKCGHEKPACRRCSTQRLKCVYSLSRRMGRPRAKTIPEDPAAKQTRDSTDPEPASKPTTTSNAEQRAEVDLTSLPDAGAADTSAPEPETRTDPWSPIVGDFNGTYDAAFLDNPNLGAVDGSMDYLLDDAPMDVDSSCEHPNMDALFGDAPLNDKSHELPSSNSEAIFRPEDLISPQTLSENVESPLDALCSSLQLQSVHNCTQAHRETSEQSSGLESRSGSSSSAPLAHMLDFEFKSVADSGYASRATADPGEPSTLSSQCGISVYSQSLESKMAKSAVDSLNGEDTPQQSMEMSSLMFPNHTQFHYPSAVLMQLSSLEVEQLKIKSLQIDRALMLETEVREALLSRVHKVKHTNQNNHIYLLELVNVKMMLDLLQAAIQSDFVARPRYSHGPASGTVLCIGNFKVTSRARASFLRKMLQARLYRLAGLLKERETNLSGIRKDGFATAASVLLGDISKSLRTLMGLVEVWSSRHL